MRKIFFLSLFSIGTLPAFGQTAVLKGKVEGAEGKDELPGAVVQLTDAKGTVRRMPSDNDGGSGSKPSPTASTT